jgi:hypothetical protein
MKIVYLLVLAASLMMAGGLAGTRIQGDYIEARNADVFTGPCFANSEVEGEGKLAVFGWRIAQGNWQGVNLDGLSVVGVIRSRGTLGDVHNPVYPVKAVLIIDERANAEQRVALKSFAQRVSNDLLTDVVRIEYRPISLQVEGGNVHGAKATLKAGELAQIATRPIHDGDHLCSNEIVWYEPLTKLDHAMPAYAMAHDYKGQGLGATWSSPEKRSAFVGNFHFEP